MAIEPTTLTKLKELLAAIQGYDDPRKAANEWKQVYKLLQKAAVSPPRITGVVGMRDVDGLVEILGELVTPPPDIPLDIPDEDTCKKAMLAFRKRLELTVLDDESKLGRSPLSKGKGSTIAAIEPPSEWPDSVWQHLARQGKLHYLGHGFYGLPRS